MTAVAAAAIAGVAISGVGLIEGANQKADAKKLAAQNKLAQEAEPPQLNQVTNLAKQNYYNGLPGYDTAKQNIQRNSQNAYINGSRGASSGGDLIDLAAKLNYGDSVATNDLATRAADYKAQALQGYEGALNNQAGYQNQLYKNNELDPYLRTANAASSLAGAGNINEFNSLDSIASDGASYAASQANNPSNQPATYGEKYGNPQIDPITLKPLKANPFDAASAIAKAGYLKSGY